MKNIKKLIFVLVLSVVGIVLIGCSETIERNAFETRNDVIAFQAISGVELLSNFKEVETQNGPVNKSENGLVIEDQIEVVNHYLGIVEKYLGTSNGLTVSEETSDLEAYTKLMVIKAVEMTGAEIEYRLYFNETVNVEEENELKDEFNNLNANLEIEEENEYLIEGILIVNQIEYAVEGFREVEEGKESLMLMAKIDEDNFVRIHYEIEEDERVFNYVIKKDGVISRTKIKVDEENGKLKVKLTFVEGTTKGQYNFEISVDEDEVQIVKVKYAIKVEDEKIEKGSIKIYVRMDEETGEPIYTYKIYGEGNNLVSEHRVKRGGHHGNTPEDFKGNKNNGGKNDKNEGKTGKGGKKA